MPIKRLILLPWVVILFMFHFIAFAAMDSTRPEIQPPPLTRQCFTVTVKDKVLHLTTETITPDVKLTECTWRGQDKVAVWALAITNAVYEQTCQNDEIAVGVKHGVRGSFGFGGEYDFYVQCCKLEVSLEMSQNWYNCPTPTPPTTPPSP